MSMDKAKFDAIKERAAARETPPAGADAVIICAKNGQPIHPDSLGKDASEQFKAYCQSIASAVADRRALLEWIAESFEIEWTD